MGQEAFAAWTAAAGRCSARAASSCNAGKTPTDTWTFHDDQWREEVEIVLGEGGWIVEEAGPLRARVRLDGRLGTSRLRWTLSLLRGDPRVFMKLEINFDERFRLLQMLFNLAQTPRERVEGVMGGSVARGLSKVEWPVHGWSRLSLEHADVALVTNDAYSVNMDANRWEWTLMRSPRMAWGGGEPAIYAGREWFTDQGIHELDSNCALGRELSAATSRAQRDRRGQR